MSCHRNHIRGSSVALRDALGRGHPTGDRAFLRDDPFALGMRCAPCAIVRTHSSRATAPRTLHANFRRRGARANTSVVQHGSIILDLQGERTLGGKVSHFTMKPYILMDFTHRRITTSFHLISFSVLYQSLAADTCTVQEIVFLNGEPLYDCKEDIPIQNLKSIRSRHQLDSKDVRL